MEASMEQDPGAAFEWDLQVDPVQELIPPEVWAAVVYYQQVARAYDQSTEDSGLHAQLYEAANALQLAIANAYKDLIANIDWALQNQQPVELGESSLYVGVLAEWVEAYNTELAEYMKIGTGEEFVVGSYHEKSPLAAMVDAEDDADARAESWKRLADMLQKIKEIARAVIAGGALAALEQGALQAIWRLEGRKA